MELLHIKGSFLEVESWEDDTHHQKTNRVETLINGSERRINRVSYYLIR